MDGFQASLKGESSLDYFNQFFKKYPKDPQLSLWLTFFMNDINESVACNEKIIKANKKFGPAYNMMGYRQMQLKNMDEAEKYFDKYIALEPDRANPYDSKGDWLMAVGKLEEAGESFDKAAELGLKVSMKKAVIAKTRMKFDEISEQDVQSIKDICYTSEESYPEEDFEKLKSVFHNQALEIFKNNLVNVGISNIKKSMENKYNNGTFLKAGVTIDDGWKTITTHYYESGTFNDDDKAKINKICQEFSSMYDFNVKLSLEMFKKQKAFFIPQSIEIFRDHRSNIGLANMEERWQYFLDGEFEYALLDPVKISGRGNKAIVCGVIAQNFKHKDADEARPWESAFTAIFTKETGDWKIQVWHWQ